MDEQQMDTDGGHDRAERRRELKRAWKRAAARYCRVLVSDKPRYDQCRRARYAMLDAYRAWKDCH